MLPELQQPAIKAPPKPIIGINGINVQTMRCTCNPAEKAIQSSSLNEGLTIRKHADAASAVNTSKELYYNLQPSGNGNFLSVMGMPLPAGNKKSCSDEQLHTLSFTGKIIFRQ